MIHRVNSRITHKADTHDDIHAPAHYIAGRTIEPIGVIESFELCHHLACVVKYLARAGRKTNLLRDLQKARWYLSREIDRRRRRVSTCNAPLSTKPPFTIQEILDDWGLSAHLGACLSYILDFRLSVSDFKGFTWTKKKLPSNSDSIVIAGNNDLLTHALEHLRIAIDDYPGEVEGGREGEGETHE